jgi:hypothetical protein
VITALVVSVMIPLQLNVTVPPPASALLNAGSSQVETMPARGERHDGAAWTLEGECVPNHTLNVKTLAIKTEAALGIERDKCNMISSCGLQGIQLAGLPVKAGWPGRALLAKVRLTV